MKIIQKSIYSLLVCGALCGAGACEKGYEEINTPYKDASENTASIGGLFNGLVSSLGKYGDDALNVSLLYPITNQQAYQNTVAPYLNYSGTYWGQYYPDLLVYKTILRKIEEQANPQSFNNAKYMASILMANKTLRMLDYYGDIPYSGASLANTEGVKFFRPAYDAQPDVYKSVLADLKAAADGLAVDPGQVSLGASETFLNSDYTAWKKFANALRLRYAVRLYNKEKVLAEGIITDIIGGNKPLPGNQNLASLYLDNFGLWPNRVASNGQILGALASKWDSYRELSISNIRMSSNVWSQMSSSNDPSGTGIYDPRCYVYFMTNNADKWVPQPQNGSQPEGGRPYDDGTARKGIGTDPANKFACVNYLMAYDRLFYPILIVTEADVHFLKAEIYQRGMGVAKDIAKAKTEYEAGITSSVNFWYAYTQLSTIWAASRPTAPTAGQMTAFLTNPAVLFNGANDADALKKIATQSWLATMFQPAETWATVRRTGLTPKDPTYNPSVVNKLPYPDDENVNNHENWQKVTNGDNPTAQVQKKVYWMQ
ncbi:SusD/RagB family nutrient-binding outer membrane lipoprotein [Chitinophaga sp. SYP-B3965]|uniref:SusD/RagB family nutrient-binding outer membrane lipoprotein n=1 Tax=Chitinophaga sp. SYP-B3965 TaxID=2663120 RepID=UPI001299D5E1|nr:SusD/RagB family nutrient-binding outer membrane lipoprotein [Chitinophaga sp. SYP-B3965]MRG44718.1 SusD/RagB family nutrient-binding outer membrane lipoprotein [Chitinophaga sp. SYP-B3965]